MAIKHTTHRFAIATAFALALICLQSVAAASAAPRTVEWKGVTAIDFCDDWSCHGTTGVNSFMLLPVAAGEDSATVTVRSLGGTTVKLWVQPPGGPSTAIETDNEDSLEVEVDGSKGDGNLRVFVYDPSIEHGGGTGVGKPLPFVASAEFI